MLLSNSLSSMASLHAQILASEGTITSFEVTAFSESMTIGNWKGNKLKGKLGLGWKSAVEKFGIRNQ